MTNKYRHDNNVAFAQSISRDFKMNARIAVEFRNKFGRLKAADCLNNYLTCQKEPNLNAAVYNWVTKLVYNVKPD